MLPNILQTEVGTVWRECGFLCNLACSFTTNTNEDRIRWETLKIQVKLILNCLSALAITCLSQKGQNFVQRTTFKVLPWLKQVCRLSESLFNKLAVARGKPTVIVSKRQQLGSIHLKQFLCKRNLKQFNFTHLFCEACNGAKLSLLHRLMIDVNKCPNEL